MRRRSTYRVPSGATLTLLKALDHCNIKARKFEGLSVRDLQSLGIPVIANIRSQPEASQFDHWVCVVANGFELAVFDGAASGQSWSVAEFAAVWNGFAIVPDYEYASRWIAFTHLISSLLFIGLGYLVAVRTDSGFFHAVLSICGLAFASVLFGGGLFGHSSATSYAAAPWVGETGNQVTLDELVRTSNDTQLVDARFVKDFRRGTIRGAVNLPVNSGYIQLREIAQSLRKDKPVVVFCQSQACKFDDVVAARLRSLGFSNVRSCEAGWREYSASRASDGP